MARNALTALLCLSLAGGPAVLVAQTSQDPEVQKGIRLVEEGDYDTAILTLDTQARRLATDPARVQDLSQAYLYLGIAYMGKGHEAAAKAKFREAVSRMKDLTLSPDKYPPKVIDAFEAARAEEARNPSPTAAPGPAGTGGPAKPAAQKKEGGSKKGLLIVGGLVAVGGGVALAAGGGGGSSAASPPTDTRKTDVHSANIDTNGSSGFQFVPTTAGTADISLTWNDPAAVAALQFTLVDALGRDVATSQPAANTEARLTTAVTNQLYTVVIYQFDYPQPLTFTLKITYP